MNFLYLFHPLASWGAAKGNTEVSEITRAKLLHLSQLASHPRNKVINSRLAGDSEGKTPTAGARWVGRQCAEVCDLHRHTDAGNDMEACRYQR